MNRVVEHLKDHGLAVKVTDSIDFGVKDVWVEKMERLTAKNLLRSIGVTVGATLRW